MVHENTPGFAKTKNHRPPMTEDVQNVKYILNPQYRLRKENSRILLYSKDLQQGTLSSSYMMLHPRSAILLTLFDGERTFDKVVEDFCYVIDDSTPLENAKLGLKNLLEWLLKENPDLLIHANSESILSPDHPSPFEFVLENEKVDLSTPNPILDFPLSVNFHLNLECNRKCLYCYAPSHIKERASMPLSKYIELFDEAVAHGVGEIQFGGADPLLNHNIIELTTEVIKRGFDPFISTKQFVSKKLANDFAQAGLKIMQVSLDSVDPEIAGKLTGCSGYLEIALASITNLQSAGLNVRVKAVATSLNIDGIPELVRVLAERKVVSVLVDAYGRSVFRHEDDLFVPNEKIKECLDRLAPLIENYPECNIATSLEPYIEPDKNERSKNWESRASCSAGRSAMTIMTDGSILVCDQVPVEDGFILGNVMGSSIMEQWNSTGVREIVYPLRTSLNEPCRSCEDYEKCCTEAGRCVRDVFVAFGTSIDGDPKCPRIDLPDRY